MKDDVDETMKLHHSTPLPDRQLEIYTYHIVFYCSRGVLAIGDCVDTHSLTPASFFSTRGSKMEPQQPGRRDDTNPAAGLMAVVRN